MSIYADWCLLTLIDDFMMQYADADSCWFWLMLIDSERCQRVTQVTLSSIFTDSFTAHLRSTTKPGKGFSTAGDAQAYKKHINTSILGDKLYNFRGTWMLTTSNMAKAVQVGSSKALAAVQAIVAITTKVAIARIEIGKSFDLGTLEVKLSLQRTKRRYISERSRMVWLKSIVFSHTVGPWTTEPQGPTVWGPICLEPCSVVHVSEKYENIHLLTQYM